MWQALYLRINHHSPILRCVFKISADRGDVCFVSISSLHITSCMSHKEGLRCCHLPSTMWAGAHITPLIHIPIQRARVSKFVKPTSTSSENAMSLNYTQTVLSCDARQSELLFSYASHHGPTSADHPAPLPHVHFAEEQVGFRSGPSIEKLTLSVKLRESLHGTDVRRLPQRRLLMMITGPCRGPVIIINNHCPRRTDIIVLLSRPPSSPMT